MKYKTYQALKPKKGENKYIYDNVVLEAPLQININNEAYTVVMRTPGDDFDLIRGLLFAEDIYKEKENPKFELIENDKNSFTIINVSIPIDKLRKGYLNKRTLLSVSSCGICGKQDLDSIKITGNKLSSKIDLNELHLDFKIKELKKHQILFDKTGGSHAACIFGLDDELLSFSEDIGRHNAVDKSIGQLINNQNLIKPKILLVSGRVSYEIITKAFIAKIPIVAAVSACSSLAIDFSKELGVNLIGFTRDQNFTIYS